MLIGNAKIRARVNSLGILRCRQKVVIICQVLVRTIIIISIRIVAYNMPKVCALIHNHLVNIIHRRLKAYGCLMKMSIILTNAPQGRKVLILRFLDLRIMRWKTQVVEYLRVVEYLMADLLISYHFLFWFVSSLWAAGDRALDWPHNTS